MTLAEKGTRMHTIQTVNGNPRIITGTIVDYNYPPTIDWDGQNIEQIDWENVYKSKNECIDQAVKEIDEAVWHLDLKRTHLVAEAITSLTEQKDALLRLRDEPRENILVTFNGHETPLQSLKDAQFFNNIEGKFFSHQTEEGAEKIAKVMDWKFNPVTGKPV